MRRAALALALISAAAADAAAGGLIAARGIAARSIVAAEDLRPAETEIPGAVSDPQEVLGLEARVAIYEGRPIRRADFGPPALIERNEQVRLRYVSGRLAIAANGRALDRGAAGERIRVMNLVSRNTVIGVVTADGEVQVAR